MNESSIPISAMNRLQQDQNRILEYIAPVAKVIHEQF